jgi:hypothetical protein
MASPAAGTSWRNSHRRPAGPKAALAFSYQIRLKLAIRTVKTGPQQESVTDLSDAMTQLTGPCYQPSRWRERAREAPIAGSGYANTRNERLKISTP